MESNAARTSAQKGFETLKDAFYSEFKQPHDDHEVFKSLDISNGGERKTSPSCVIWGGGVFFFSPCLSAVTTLWICCRDLSWE